MNNDFKFKPEHSQKPGFEARIHFSSASCKEEDMCLCVLENARHIFYSARYSHLMREIKLIHSFSYFVLPWN